MFYGRFRDPSDSAFMQTVVERFRKIFGTVYAADNVILLDRTLGFRRDKKLMQAFRRNAKTAQEKSLLLRINTLAWGAQQALGVEGDFVECGVWRGFCSSVIAEFLDFGTLPRKFYLYDTFEGIPADLDPEGHDAPAFREAGLYEGVVERFARYPNVRVIKGRVPETLHAESPSQIALLHIDMNSSTAEIAALEVLFDRVVPGGIIIFDDYGWVGYRAQLLAEDDWTRARGHRILELPTGQGLLVKQQSSAAKPADLARPAAGAAAPARSAALPSTPSQRSSPAQLPSPAQAPNPSPATPVRSGEATPTEAVEVSEAEAASRPVFIVAPARRCGTTLLQRALNSSKNAIIYGENFTFLEAYPAFLPGILGSIPLKKARTRDVRREVLGGNYDIDASAMFPDYGDYARLMKGHFYEIVKYYENWSREYGRHVWGLKHQIRKIDGFAAFMELMPAARYVFVYRNVFDVARSDRARFPGDYASAESFARLGQTWARNIEFMRSIRKPNVMHIEYEAFQNDLPALLQRLERHCGVSGIKREVFGRRVNVSSVIDNLNVEEKQTGYRAPAELSAVEFRALRAEATAQCERFGYAVPALPA